MVDTLLLNEEDGDVLGLDRCIGIAMASHPKNLRHAMVLYGEMLGEKWVLDGNMMMENRALKKSPNFQCITLIRGWHHQ